LAAATSVVFVAASFLPETTRLGSLTLWFFVAATITNTVKLRSDRLRCALDFRTWISVIANVGTYVSLIVGNIPPKFGGTAPMPAVLYLNKPIEWLDSKTTAPVSLLDETDQGYYVLEQGKRKAFFVPRGDVSSVYFGPAEDLPKPKP
jgi:hypothetical protein